jgi:PKD repeat protein
VIIDPAFPIADFETPENGCSPHTVKFVNKSQYSTNYVWEFGDGSISTKKDPEYTYYVAGVYAITLNVTGPGGTHTFKSTVEVYPTPKLQFSNFPDSVFVNDKPVKFYNLSGDATDYLWNFGDVNETTGQVNPSNTSTEIEPAHIYMNVGLKDVTLIGWNANCRDTLFVEEAVKVKPAGRLAFPNVFKPNPNGPTGGAYNQNDPASNNSVFFPGIIDEVLEYHLYIYTRWGVQVFQSNDINIGWDGYINGQKAKQGVYIWKVKGKYTNGRNFQEAGDVTLLH